MRLLLDTHVLIWWLANDSKLATNTREIIANPNNLVFVSAASAWEIAIKKSLGKLEAPDDLAMQIKNHNFEELPIKIEHGIGVEQLPWHHKDPFDRIIIAQAICESLTVVTRDRKLVAYNVSIHRC